LVPKGKKKKKKKERSGDYRTGKKKGAAPHGILGGRGERGRRGFRQERGGKRKMLLREEFKGNKKGKGRGLWFFVGKGEKNVWPASKRKKILPGKGGNWGSVFSGEGLRKWSSFRQGGERGEKRGAATKKIHRPVGKKGRGGRGKGKAVLHPKESRFQKTKQRNAKKGKRKSFFLFSQKGGEGKRKKKGGTDSNSLQKGKASPRWWSGEGEGMPESKGKKKKKDSDRQATSHQKGRVKKGGEKGKRHSQGRKKECFVHGAGKEKRGKKER